MTGAPVPDCDPPPAPPPPARRPLPAGTCDTHLHVFGPHSRYPLAPRRSYTPHECSLAQYRQVMAALGIARAVLVQPSVYGSDNSALLEALRQAGAAFRGVAVPRHDVTDDDLRHMHALGVRGIRLNLVNPRVLDLDATVALCERVALWGWHLQLLLDLAGGGAGTLGELCRRTRLPIVVDHMGCLPPAGPPTGPLFDLLAAGRCWVKLSAPYRVSEEAAPYRDLASLARALARANPEQVLWGSDWPHTEQHAGTPPATVLSDLLHEWFPDPAALHRICVTNPARLYQFPEELSA